MFDTMTVTKVVGSTCAALLAFLLLNWASDGLYAMSAGGHGEGEEHAQAYVIDTGEAGRDRGRCRRDGRFRHPPCRRRPPPREKVFGKCKACHKMDGTDGTGPHLNGIVNKAKAASAGLRLFGCPAGHGRRYLDARKPRCLPDQPQGYAGDEDVLRRPAQARGPRQPHRLAGDPALIRRARARTAICPGPCRKARPLRIFLPLHPGSRFRAFSIARSRTSIPGIRTRRHSVGQGVRQGGYSWRQGRWQACRRQCGRAIRPGRGFCRRGFFRRPCPSGGAARPRRDGDRLARHLDLRRAEPARRLPPSALRQPRRAEGRRDEPVRLRRLRFDEPLLGQGARRRGLLDHAGIDPRRHRRRDRRLLLLPLHHDGIPRGPVLGDLQPARRHPLLGRHPADGRGCALLV